MFVDNNSSVPPCPCCGGTLSYRDTRSRICRLEGGGKEFFRIRRLRCSQCGTLHNELPDCLVPHKHYAAEVISGVLDGFVTPYDEDSEEYPCFATMRRWIYWFRGNLANMEGYLRRAGSSILKLGKDVLFATESLVGAIRTAYPDWLERILRIIYNSGGKLSSARGW
ncbi:MAG: DUF6431 domain-containing protein [Clostridia bacterium]|nr:DUF6431 domain-containing protein [Clostridia bacterium]